MDTKASQKNEVLLTLRREKKWRSLCVKSEIVTHTIKADVGKGNRIIELSRTFFTARLASTAMTLRLTISACANLIVQCKTQNGS